MIKANGEEYVDGQVSSGAYTGSYLALPYVITGKKGAGTRLHPVTLQSFANTQPLSLRYED